MEFNEKLQELRKRKGLTQEQLAKELYVSRTAVSKWESGRGVPNIESLKGISEYFSVSVDELLSQEELFTIADEDSRQRENNIKNLVFGLLDFSMIILLFLPLFAQRENGGVSEVSLLALSGVSDYIRVAYFVVVSALIIMGVLALALQNCEWIFWQKYKHIISVFLSVAGIVCFMLTLQTYAGLLTFVFLAIKTIMLIKWR